MDFAPGMWLNPLLDSGNGFGAVVYGSAFATFDVGRSKFPDVSKIEYPSISFADVDCPEYQDVWNDSYYAPEKGGVVKECK